jgi:hypothetical protein
MYVVPFQMLKAPLAFASSRRASCSAQAASAQAPPLCDMMMLSRDTMAAVREGETPGSTDNEHF